MRVYETMTRITCGRYRVRVWTNIPDPEQNNPYGVNKEAREKLRVLDRPNPKQIAKTLDQLPDIAAYEILDGNGNGFVVYNDWP